MHIRRSEKEEDGEGGKVGTWERVNRVEVRGVGVVGMDGVEGGMEA